MRNESLLRLIIKILERFTATFLVLLQIVVSAIRNAFELLPSKREIVFDVVGALGIKGALSTRYIQHVQFRTPNTDVLVKLQPFFQPVIEPFHPLLCPAKIFQLHLLEFAGAEREIARIDFITKGFSNLCDPEWQLLARHFEDVLELNEDRLRRFRPQICG